MSNFTAIVDVAIGLSLIYLGVSLYVTIVNEFIAQKLQLRGKQLAEDLTKLIDDPNLRSALAANPALAPFVTSNGKPGSYVDPDIVARLLLGAARGGQATVATMEELIGAINALPASELKKQLQAIAQSASDNVEAFIGTVSHWVDQSLTMMGEVYKPGTRGTRRRGKLQADPGTGHHCPGPQRDLRATADVLDQRR
jgi:hypothetical protein